MKYQIDVSQLKIGMYVCELDRPWLDTTFLFQGFQIRDTVEIDTLQSICEYVYVDSDKTVTSPGHHLLSLSRTPSRNLAILPPAPQSPSRRNSTCSR